MKNKNILIGITGGIAAYKTASLIRLFVKAGCNVKVVMTPTAKQFITPLTVATLSKNPVYSDFFNPENGEWNSHVKLGIWADLFVIAPCTANTIAKMAYGIADNLLLTTCLSARCKIMFAPAMDLDMYSHVTTQQNIQTLKNRDYLCVEANDGELASGLSGKGRMAEPEEIFEAAKQYLLTKDQENQDFFGKNVLVTSGPTREKLDPVRYISNYSTGKMGYSIAMEFANRGANVIFVSGPVEKYPLHSNVDLIKIESAEQMYQKCMENFPNCDVAVLSAAVADFTPNQIADNKIKKQSEDSGLNLELVATKDIAKSLGQIKQKNQILCGFALETFNEESNAQKKLKSKNLDMIVLNSLNDKGAGFGYDTNKVKFIFPEKESISFELKSKDEVAKDIVNQIFGLF